MALTFDKVSRTQKANFSTNSTQVAEASAVLACAVPLPNVENYFLRAPGGISSQDIFLLLPKRIAYLDTLLIFLDIILIYMKSVSPLLLNHLLLSFFLVICYAYQDVLFRSTFMPYFIITCLD